MKAAFFSICLLFLINSCGVNKAITINSETAISSLHGAYTVSELNGNSIIDEELTLDIDATRKAISGNSGCNQYFGSIVLEENGLRFTKVGMTKKLCPEKNIMKLEKELIAALGSINEGVQNSVSEIILNNDTSKLIVLKKKE